MDLIQSLIGTFVVPVSEFAHFKTVVSNHMRQKEPLNSLDHQSQEAVIVEIVKVVGKFPGC
jgi:hypothetical protein